MPQHRPPLSLRRVASADRGANARQLVAHSLRLGVDLVQRGLEVALDIVREGSEWGDVHRLQAILELAFDGAAKQPIEDHQERGQRLAGSRGGCDESVLAARDGRPSQLLRLGRLAEAALEPGPDGRTEVDALCCHDPPAC